MNWVDSMELLDVDSPYELLFKAALLIPISHYLFGLLFVLIVFLYNFLEMHVLGDLFTGFRGQPVTLTFNSSSQVYQDIASRCKTLHGRYLSTPWLCSPHLQTGFLHFFGRPPVVNYKRQLFITSDEGTIALDWLTNAEVKKQATQLNDAVQIDGKDPIMIVVPGLTSDSDSAYVKHLVFKMAKSGWNVVVSNHRGLGGVSITSDCLYNAGWTEDVRKVIDHLHCLYPEAPLYTVGTSIGANILVKYLGEDGSNVPLIGAAAICSPWDLLICDRFINRRPVQKFYDKALTFGLKGYADLHHAVLSRLADWEGIKKSRSVRDFDNYATRIVGKYETVDTYYRRCSSSSLVGNVMVPLLCISTIDDPVCTSEAIPWDECRLNNNIVLATTQHGGHLGFFEGITAKSVWWVRAVDEFFGALQSSPLYHRKKEIAVPQINPQESLIDQAPYLNVEVDGLVTAVRSEPIADVGVEHEENIDQNKSEDAIQYAEEVNHRNRERENEKIELVGYSDITKQDASGITTPVKKCLNQISRQNRKSLWLLAYIAIIMTWPVVGSAPLLFLKKKFQNFVSGPSLRR
ncbi:embryogenesis-associated protein EMB8 [Olea europaea var. sylvestris]|uniref:embryogenesis-associated protein EMB8 n=1 Tax=Olea europaea var. sylvestris TaxID=158386 RepID=UPI000C1D6094|nr:embryogenesis-associated protein EMB8 [Olea europaea var. sylvestris]